MEKLKQLATNRPVLFGLVITLLLVVIELISVIITRGLDGSGQQIVYALGSLTGTLIFIYILRCFGWLRSAGITHLGNWRSWLFVLPVIAYVILENVYVIFGDFSFNISDPALAGSLALYHLISGGLLQQFAFRGLILHALVRSWGDSKQGPTKSALVSAVFFSLVHIFNLLFFLADPSWKSAQVILLQVLETLFSGFFLAAFVLFVDSIWPAAMLHGLVNAIVNVKALGAATFEETVSMWVLVILFELPVVIYSVYLLRRVPPRSQVPDTAQLPRNSTTTP